MIPTRRTSNWLPDIFNEMFDYTWMNRTNATAPAINIVENVRSYRIEVAAPGLKKEDFNLHIDESNRIVIRMEKHNENKEERKQDHYLRREFTYSKFVQTIMLPENVDRDAIQAEVKEGVLEILLPKRAIEEPEHARKSIEVK